MIANIIADVSMGSMPVAALNAAGETGLSIDSIAPEASFQGHTLISEPTIKPDNRQIVWL